MKNLSHFLIVLVLFILACKGSSTSSNKNASNADTIGLKDLADYRMAFLENSPYKIIDVLGEPDLKQFAKNMLSGHFVYYNKVKDEGVVKHLVLYFDYFNKYSESQTVKRVEAIKDGRMFYTRKYGSFIIKFKPPRITGVNNIESEVDRIRLAYNNVDLGSLNKYYIDFRGDFVQYYYDDQLHLIAITNTARFDDDASLSHTYFFEKDKLKYILKKLDGFDDEETFIDEDKVYDHIIGRKKHEKGEALYQKWDETTEPYVLLKMYYDDQGD